MSQYEMTVVHDTVVVKKDNLSETYTLTAQPPRNSVLVQEEKQAILGQVDLEQMLQNLDSCVDLLQIAYNAVNGMKKLHGSVSDLQLRLTDTLILSNNTIQRFCYKTDSIIGKFIDAYENLLTGNEDIAVKNLSEVKEDATQMRKDSETLGDRFAAVATDTEVVLKATIEQNTDNYEKRDAVIAESNRMAAEAAAFEALKANLERSIQELNEEYNNLLKRQEKQEERAFALQLTGAILGGLGIVAKSAIEVTAEMHASSGSPGVGAQSQPELDKAKKEKEDLEAEIKDIDDQLDEIEEKLDAAADDAERKPLHKEKQSLLKQKETKNNRLQKAETAIAALSKSIADAGDQFTKMGQDLQNYADKYDARLTEIFNLRKELQKQERENLVKLEEYTKKIANAVISKDSLETAISSLITAIGCLRKVVSHLKDMVAFWKSIEVCCESLAGDDTLKAIGRLQRKYAKSSEPGADLALRTQPYRELSFMRIFLTYLVRWVALNEICKEYMAALQETRSRLSATIGEEEMDREAHWANASELASKLNTKLRQQLSKAI